MTRFDDIDRAASASGLAASALHPEEGGTVVLLAYAGRPMWAAFSAAPEAADGAPDPLDRWSARIAGALARDFGARPVLPSDRPYPPFLRWAMAAEPVWPSPLGMLIHAERGLWVSYRAALAFDARLDIPRRPEAEQPCDACPSKPCLSACPVGAFTDAGYDVPACVGWISRAEGEDCLGQGCRARRACPVGRAYAHAPDQARHHMTAFLRAHARDDAH